MQNYQIDPIHLGSGISGIAYRAKRISDGVQVCLKISEDILDEKDREMFEKEIKIFSALNHQNIVDFISYFWDGNKIVIEMELADGDRLHDVMKQNPNMPEEDILFYFVQIFEAVQYMHQRKIIHRDLKPENIFLMHDGTVKIGDFGVSRFIENNSSFITCAGSPLYMAIELLKNLGTDELSNQAEAGLPIDIWSLGCIMYEMMTGNVPYPAESILELTQKVNYSNPAPISGNYSDELKNIVSWMLIKNPEDRITVDQLLNQEIFKQYVHQIALLNEYPPTIWFYHQTLSTPSEALHFPFTKDSTKGVFSYLSKIPVQDFVNEILTKNMIQGNFILFRFLCLSDSFSLLPETKNQFFQFSFKTKKISLEGFLLEMDSTKFPLCWKLEASPDNFVKTKNWITIFKQDNQQCLDQNSPIFETIQNPCLFSSFKFTMIGNNSANSNELFLKKFDIFGILLDSTNFVSSLRKLVSKIKPSFYHSEQYKLPISETRNLGFFNSFSRLSSNYALKCFSLVRSPTVQGTSIFNLFRWDDTIWESRKGSNKFLSFMFRFGFAFKLEGYRIRAGKRYFPKSWKIEGIMKDIRYVCTIDEQNENASVCSPFAEKTFSVQSDQFYRGFRFTQIGLNAEGTGNFSLSAIEWYGTLVTFDRVEDSPVK